MLSENLIEKLIAAGGHRWTKAGHDRIYFSGAAVKIATENLPAPEIQYPAVDMDAVNFWVGRHISRRVARCLYAAAAYIDVKTGEIELARNCATTPAARDMIFDAIINRVRYILVSARRADIREKIRTAVAAARAEKDAAEILQKKIAAILVSGKPAAEIRADIRRAKNVEYTRRWRAKKAAATA